VIHELSFSSKVHVVFDDEDAGSNNDAVFKKLSRFIHDHLEFTADFLGSLPRDEHFERSITNQRPLVLMSGASVTKDVLTRICSLLLEGYRGQEEMI
jgi:MinD-like ATPase involved in chromosome partitioning or flagellar assembly